MGWGIWNTKKVKYKLGFALNRTHLMKCREVIFFTALHSLWTSVRTATPEVHPTLIVWNAIVPLDNFCQNIKKGTGWGMNEGGNKRADQFHPMTLTWQSLQYLFGGKPALVLRYMCKTLRSRVGMHLSASLHLQPPDLAWFRRLLCPAHWR